MRDDGSHGGGAAQIINRAGVNWAAAGRRDRPVVTTAAAADAVDSTLHRQIRLYRSAAQIGLTQARPRHGPARS
jgi:hypothetical protein